MLRQLLRNIMTNPFFQLLRTMHAALLRCCYRCCLHLFAGRCCCSLLLLSLSLLSLRLLLSLLLLNPTWLDATGTGFPFSLAAAAAAAAAAANWFFANPMLRRIDPRS